VRLLSFFNAGNRLFVRNGFSLTASFRIKSWSCRLPTCVLLLPFSQHASVKLYVVTLCGGPTLKIGKKKPYQLQTLHNVQKSLQRIESPDQYSPKYLLQKDFLAAEHFSCIPIPFLRICSHRATLSESLWDRRGAARAISSIAMERSPERLTIENPERPTAVPAGPGPAGVHVQGAPTGIPGETCS
jgi:hypothetical protein